MRGYDSVQQAIEVYPTGLINRGTDGLFLGATAAPAPSGYGVG